jgi:hypothetical protein
VFERFIVGNEFASHDLGRLMAMIIPIKVDDDPRQRLHLDLLQAWETYQTEGNFLTIEEADYWLAKLENGEDTEIPL